MSNRSVAETVWPWRKGAGSSKEPFRQGRAVLESAVGIALGLLLWLRWDKPVIGLVALTMGSLVLLGGLFMPRLYKAIKRGGLVLGRGLGTAVSWILLVPFFYLVFGFGRLCFLMLRRDPLERRLDPKRTSYWSDRRPVSRDQYLKQY